MHRRVPLIAVVAAALLTFLFGIGTAAASLTVHATLSAVSWIGGGKVC